MEAYTSRFAVSQLLTSSGGARRITTAHLTWIRAALVPLTGERERVRLDSRQTTESTQTLAGPHVTRMLVTEERVRRAVGTICAV